MSTPTLNYVSCPDSAAGHRMAYWQWGDAQAAHVVLCVHGLTRQGRDFDVLAQALLARAGGALRVVCPDVVGRGRSDWLGDPMAYQIPTYAADMLALLAQLRPQTLDWVGTSMGGLIGMAICGQAGLPLPVPVRRLVLNDVGPAIQWEAVTRIGAYLGQNMEFASLQHAADALWAISTGFGPHTPAQWLALCRPLLKPVAESGERVRLRYDPALAQAFDALTPAAADQAEATVWALYDGIQAQTLLLRGAESDLLSEQTAQQMAVRGPQARVVTFAGVGHAPTLVAEDQVRAVGDFLFG